MTQSLSDPFFFLLKWGHQQRADSQIYLLQVAPSDCSLGSKAGEKMQAGKALSVCQGSVQSKAECSGKRLQGSTDPIYLGQPSLGRKGKSHSGIAPVLEMRVKTPVPLFTLPPPQDRALQQSVLPQYQAEVRKLPRLAPSLKSASLAQQVSFLQLSSPGPAHQRAHQPPRAPAVALAKMSAGCLS